MIKKGYSPFHNWLGSLLKELLTPVDITVESEFKVMSQSPTTDYYLLSQNSKSWNLDQKKRLPDGIRELNIGRVLIEFKCTESVTERALMKIMGTDALCKEYLELKNSEIQTILISSKSTSKKFLSNCGYKSEKADGVYQSVLFGFRFIDLILLNELADTPYNAPFKLFASQTKERNHAFEQLSENEAFLYSNRLEALRASLFHNLASFKNLKDEELSMTTDELVRKGRKLMENYWFNLATDEDRAQIPLDVRLKGVTVQERMEGVPVEKRMEGVPVEKRMEGVPVEKRMEGVPVEEIIKKVPLEKRMEGVPFKEIIKLFPEEELEQFFEKKKRKVRKNK